MNGRSTFIKRLRSLKRFFVFYQKPEYVRTVKQWLDIRPEDIPAVETSDCERLCRNPLVSVLITTYNQEQFIRQAIESALRQTTDFEYEILVGDDCSTDKTGQICAEYQRRHPEKIRFITAERNLWKSDGNGNRLRHLARGEFLAPLEGDDYWTDKEKLQKQVETLCKHPEVTLCLAGSETLHLDGRIEYAHNGYFDQLLSESSEREGAFFTADDLFNHSFGFPFGVAMFRKSDLDFAALCTFYYRTSFTIYYLLLKKGKGFLLKKPMVMYRKNPNGVFSGLDSFQRSKFQYEFYAQLSIHDPQDKCLMQCRDIFWKRFRGYLFPWRILSDIKRFCLRTVRCESAF